MILRIQEEFIKPCTTIQVRQPKCFFVEFKNRLTGNFVGNPPYGRPPGFGSFPGQNAPPGIAGSPGMGMWLELGFKDRTHMS